jgi:hypothetical protein
MKRFLNYIGFWNGKIWARSCISWFIFLWSYVLFALFTPYELQSWSNIPNLNYDPSLGQVFIEECWTEGHPAYGDIVCGEVDKNPQYIQNPEGLKHEMYLGAFMFIFLFAVHRLNEEENFW